MERRVHQKPKEAKVICDCCGNTIANKVIKHDGYKVCSQECLYDIKHQSAMRN